jgi:hypothetical protein
VRIAHRLHTMVVWLMYCGVIRSGPQEFLPEDRAWGSAFHRPISNSVLGAKLPAEKGAQLLDETQNPGRTHRNVAEHQVAGAPHTARQPVERKIGGIAAAAFSSGTLI